MTLLTVLWIIVAVLSWLAWCFETRESNRLRGKVAELELSVRTMNKEADRTSNDDERTLGIIEDIEQRLGAIRDIINQTEGD